MARRMSRNPLSDYLEELLKALSAHGGLNPPTPKPTSLAALFSTPPQPNALTLASLAFPQKSRSEEHTSELQSTMRISYAVFCLKKNKKTKKHNYTQQHINNMH